MMARSLEELKSEALALSTEDRGRLAQVLIASLDESAEEDPAEVERAWEEEIRQRLEEHRSGRARAIPAAEVLAEARLRVRTIDPDEPGD